MPTLAAVTHELEQLAPLRLAADWDAVGLLVGGRRDRVERVMTCLTLTDRVAAEAVAERADLVVVHHPIPFRPIARITTATGTGRVLLALIESGASIWSPHTAWDSAAGGINDQLAALLDLDRVTPLEPAADLPLAGFGRAGTAAAGVTVYVASYRLPGDGWAAGPAVALQDAQRALRLVRARAAARGHDPRRVGVMGFSAGGHVAGCLGLMWDRPTYAAVDDNDRLSARPDSAVVVYPVATMSPPFAHPGSRERMFGPSPTPELERAWSLEANARPDAPPTFLLHAADDAAVPVENSLRLASALRAAKVATELHLFEEGGHGFGLRFAKGRPVEAWPDLVLAWWKRKGFV